MRCGIKSRVGVCMERYGLNHDQAIEHIKQVAEDEEARSCPRADPAGLGDDAERGTGRANAEQTRRRRTRPRGRKRTTKVPTRRRRATDGMDVDFERLARNAVRAYRAVKRIARDPEREPAWPTIMADLGTAYSSSGRAD